MREIKFRGKTYQGKWIYGYCYKVKSIFDSNIFNWFIRNDYEKDEMIIPETLSQYTGLKDKNGVEIYEGDILRDYGNDIEDWVVSYEYGKFVGTFDNICEDLYEIHDLEVIGNIYENKELLKKEGK